ncbi:ABC transporter ATP-binding protein [Microvirga sp. VF16]|uniref:ABC transporter ATP-binding protein n=1 Tax=Microvirga sp. VF16 TaxID=2807101 RepID=UPI00193D744E|nr:ATP-binding cassette domain-containing protein [Microvirga sp. VF16]QRM32811.1 ABC transporter ATP-binding protein [Microvirga sp. VF16]
MQPFDRENAFNRDGWPLLDLNGVGFDYHRSAASARPTLCDVSFAVSKGQAVGLIGQSGSGKSTIAKLVLGLARPRQGTISFEGGPVTHHDLQSFRRRVQPIFQNPMDALDPRMTVGDQLMEPLLVNFRLPRSERMERVAAALESVGLSMAIAAKLPRHISGGQAQRVTIARALLVEPELLICDEPVSALDMTVQAQILNLLNELRERRGLSLLFISHDIRAISYLCSEIVVLHRGRVVESGLREDVLLRPAAEYTRTLLASVPSKTQRSAPVAGRESLSSEGPEKAVLQ